MLGHEVPYHSKCLLQQNWTFRHCKTCHKGPHEHNQDLNLLAPQIKLKAKKKKKKVLQSLILGARFSSHSPDIFEDSL